MSAKALGGVGELLFLAPCLVWAVSW